MRFIICTTPPGAAEAIIRQLLDARVVAGCNIIPGLRSLYRWRGDICDEAEELMLLETSSERCAEAMAMIEALHPYEVPKIVAITAADATAGYLRWVEDCVEAAPLTGNR